MESKAFAQTVVNSELTFNPASRFVSFGRTQTFPLRLGWLPKLCAFLSKQTASEQKSGGFSDDDMMAELGIGKNMVTAIKHWARATDVINNNMTLSDFGTHIFGADGFDPYLEDDATLWLLHWKIASRPRFFTAGYFLFNHCFNLDDFTADQLLDDIVNKTKSAGVSCQRGSVKGDIQAALNMYAMRHAKRGDGDEGLESPFPLLGLIRATESARYGFATEQRESLPSAVVGYAATELFAATESNVMQLEFSTARHVAGNSAKTASLAAVFRITEDSLLQKLGAFCTRFPSFVLRETAGGWQLFLNGNPPPPLQLLKAIYADTSKERTRSKSQATAKKTQTLDTTARSIHAT